MAGTEVAKLLDMTQSAVRKAVQRGEKLALENNFDLLRVAGCMLRVGSCEVRGTGKEQSA